MKPLTFHVLLALTEGDKHGWALVRELQARDPDERILPGNFYRTLRGMLAEGLIEESAPPANGAGRRGPASERARRGAGDPAVKKDRRTYFTLTKAGRDAAKAEARRLEQLVAESRARKLLATKGR